MQPSCRSVISVKLQSNFIEITLRHKACNLIKKVSLTQVFSCKCCEISKNTFFYRAPPLAASQESQQFCPLFFHLYIGFFGVILSDSFLRELICMDASFAKYVWVLKVIHFWWSLLLIIALFLLFCMLARKKYQLSNNSWENCWKTLIH